MKIALLTDTHLAVHAIDFMTNCDRAVDWINASSVDLVIHLGDVTADGVLDSKQFRDAASLLSRLHAPLLVVPGNHDIGEPAALQSHIEPPLNAARLESFRAAFGADYWLRRSGNWSLIGLNTQLFGSIVEEEAQLAWLEEVTADGHGPWAVFCHKPWFLDGPDDAAHSDRYPPRASIARLQEVLASRDVRFVASGHVHQYRHHIAAGIEHLWIGSTAFVIPDHLQETIGEKWVGLALLTLEDDDYAMEAVRVPGMRDLDLTQYVEVYPQLTAILGR